MTSLDGAAVEAHLRRLDGERCAAFVADLWAARGFETDREGAVVTATREGVTRRLYCPSRVAAVARPGTDRSADVVVAPRGAPASGARVVDATDLREMLWYAVDREVAAELCSRYLGAPPDALRPPLGERLRRRARRAEPLAAPALLATGLVLLVVFGALGGGAWFGAASGDAVDSAGDGPAESGAATVPVETATTQVAAASRPPGLGPGGIENLSALAAAHDRALGNRSYTIWIDRYRPRESDPVGRPVQRDVDVAVAGDRYLARITVEDHYGERTPKATVYHDGTDRFVAEYGNGTARYRRIDDGRRIAPDPFALQRSLVTRYLSTPRTEVTRVTGDSGWSMYRVRGTGPPAAPALEDVNNYSVVALVKRGGLVLDLTAEFTVVTENRTVPVRIEFTYDRLGRTRVDPPAWYERRYAGNATAAR